MGLRAAQPRRIYVASSWRNPIQPAVVEALRLDGHEVYDFRNPTEGNTGFSWHKIDLSVPAGPADLRLPADQIRSMLNHPEADDGFALDMGALEWCDTCVLVLPSGRSAHLEAGWATGAGKYTVVLLDEGEPDLMWKMCDALCVSLAEVRTALTTSIRPALAQPTCTCEGSWGEFTWRGDPDWYRCAGCELRTRPHESAVLEPRDA